MLEASESHCEDECERGCQTMLPGPFICGFSQPHVKLLNHTGALRICTCTSASLTEDKTEKKTLSDVSSHLHIAVLLFSLLSHRKSVGEWWFISEVSIWMLGHLHSRFAYLGGHYETPPKQI